MAAKSDANTKPCCKEPVLIDEGSQARRCQSCGAQWTRAVKDSDYTAWQRVTTPPTDSTPT